MEGSSWHCIGGGDQDDPQEKGEEREKVGWKLNIQKKITASGPITSWEIDGETVETVSDFIFGCSKITADGEINHMQMQPWN